MGMYKKRAGDRCQATRLPRTGIEILSLLSQFRNLSCAFRRRNECKRTRGNVEVIVPRSVRLDLEVIVEPHCLLYSIRTDRIPDFAERPRSGNAAIGVLAVSKDLHHGNNGFL